MQLLFAAPEGAEVQVEASSLPAGAAPGAMLDLTWAVADTLVYPAAEAGPQESGGGRMMALRRIDPVGLLVLPAVLYLGLVYGLPLLNLLARALVIDGVPIESPASSNSSPIRSTGS